MLRREFFGGIATVPFTGAEKSEEPPNVEQLLCQLENASRRELGGITKVTMSFDPSSKTTPIVFVVFRI